MIHRHHDTTLREDLCGIATKAASKAGSKAHDVAETGADIGLDRAADGLEKAAGKVRDHSGDHRIQAAVTTKTADGIDRAAEYLKDHDSADLAKDLRHLVRQHPLKMLLAALVVGYLAARALRR